MYRHGLYAIGARLKEADAPVADRQHAARVMFREQSSRCCEGNILTVNVSKDADLAGEQFSAVHAVAS